MIYYFIKSIHIKGIRLYKQEDTKEYIMHVEFTYTIADPLTRSLVRTIRAIIISARVEQESLEKNKKDISRRF